MAHAMQDTPLKMKTLYRCQDCGTVFEELTKSFEHHSEIDPPNIETVQIPVCPACGSDDAITGTACKWCGDGFCDLEQYCDTCMDDLDAYLSAYRNDGVQVPKHILVEMVEQWLERNE